MACDGIMKYALADALGAGAARPGLCLQISCGRHGIVGVAGVEEPRVRRLTAGASGIRTLGPTSEGANNTVERRRSWLRGRAARKAAIAPREMIDNYLRHLGIREQPAMPGLSHHQSR